MCPYGDYDRRELSRLGLQLAVQGVLSHVLSRVPDMCHYSLVTVTHFCRLWPCEVRLAVRRVAESRKQWARARRFAPCFPTSAASAHQNDMEMRHANTVPLAQL